MNFVYDITTEKLKYSKLVVILFGLTFGREVRLFARSTNLFFVSTEFKCNRIYMRKNARKIVTLECKHCKNSFKKFKKEYDRQIRKGRSDFYCDLSCSAKANESLMEHAQFNKDNPTAFASLNPHPKDELTPFRAYINKIKGRTKRWHQNRITEITPEYLKELWEKQGGVCPYTGIKMLLRDYNQPSYPHNASVDRIDSSKNYLRGNVEFVCVSINYAKNSFSKEEMIDFIKLIRASATLI